jgi:hypothetical protein
LHTTLASIASVLTFLQAGYLALRLISGARIRVRLTAGHPPGISESLALSYGIGVGLLSTELLVLSLLGVRFTVFRVLTLWPVAWVIHLWMLRRKASPERSEVAPRDRELWSLALLIPLAAVMLLLLLRASFTPPWAWDEWAIWDLKARAFYLDGGVGRFVSDPYYVHSRGAVAYPLLYPLSGTLLYLAVGSVQGPVQVIPVLFYASTLVVFFTTLRRLGSGRTTAALLTTGFGFLPNVLDWAGFFQAEIPLVFYSVTFACYLFLYSRDPRPWYLLVAAISAGFLTQVRPDGLAIIGPGVLWLAAGVRRHGTRPLVTFAAVVACVYIPWFLVSTFLPGVTAPAIRIETTPIQEALKLVPGVVATMLAWMSDSSFLGPYVLIFPLALLMVVMNWRRYGAHSGESFLLFTALVSLLPHIVLLVTVPYWLTINSMSRYLIVFTCIVYLIFALHAAEAAQGESRAGAAVGLKMALKVSIALAAALLLTSAPNLLSKTGSRAVAWDFRDGAAGWVDGSGATAPTATGALAFPTGGEKERSVVSPPVRIDGDVTKSLRLVARGTPGVNARLSLLWRRLKHDYAPDQVVSVVVGWSGVFQQVVFEPPWRGTIEEVRLVAEGEGDILVRAIESEPRWLSLIALALRTSTSNFTMTVALTMALLVAGGLLATRREEIPRIASIAFAIIVVVLWILPGISPVLTAATGGRETSRPFGLARQVLNLWTGFGRLPLDVRLERLEAARGRPHFWPLMRETAARCGSEGDVVVWASPGAEGAHPTDYMLQRSSYLLYPSKVFFAHQPEQLTELRRHGPVSALIAYGAQPPTGVTGNIDYSPARGFGVVCAPFADARR